MDRNRDTGLALTLICLILALVFGHQYYVVAGLVCLVLTMIAPKWCFFVTPVWFGFSHILGNIVSKIVYLVIFLGVATPIGLLRRLAGNDALGLKNWNKKGESAFKKRDYLYQPQDLQTPY